MHRRFGSASCDRISPRSIATHRLPSRYWCVVASICFHWIIPSVHKHTGVLADKKTDRQTDTLSLVAQQLTFSIVNLTVIVKLTVQTLTYAHEDMQELSSQRCASAFVPLPLVARNSSRCNEHERPASYRNAVQLSYRERYCTAELPF